MSFSQSEKEILKQVKSLKEKGFLKKKEPSMIPFPYGGRGNKYYKPTNGDL